MSAITPQTSVLTSSQLVAAIRAQLLAALCVELLLYGTFIATTFLTIRALLVVRKTPYQSWKSRWHYVLAACAMFVIGTCDVAFTMWINFLAALTQLDDQQISTLSMTNYNLYLSVHVRYVLAEATELQLKSYVLVRKLLFTCKSSLRTACS
jgi:hypothetical protein